MVPSAATIVVEIDPLEVEKLRALLAGIQSRLATPACPFTPNGLTHFARFTILHNHTGNTVNSGPRSRLLFSAIHDGDFETYLSALAKTFGTTWDDIWQCCAGYPSLSGKGDSAQQLAYFKTHRARTQTYFAGYRGRSVREVHNAMRLRESIEEFLDLPAVEEVLCLLPRLPRRVSRRPWSVRVGAAPLKAVRTGRAAWSETVGNYFLSRISRWIYPVRKRGAQRSTPPGQSRAHVRELVAIEDQYVQNQMTVIVPVKPSRVRMLRRVLWGLQKLVDWVLPDNGQLAGMATIHFAHWSLLDNDTRLAFISHYDGSWERYIEEFVDNACWWLNIIWGNCADFPAAGSQDFEAFKSYIRRHQLPAQVFYSAYPTATIQNIRNDLALAEGVGAFVSQPHLATWLRRL